MARIYYVGNFPVSDELYHTRTKGSKNGVRRYQNEDGSLTPLGRIHYGIGKAKDAVGSGVSSIAKKAGSGASSLAKKAGSSISSNARAAGSAISGGAKSAASKVSSGYSSGKKYIEDKTGITAKNNLIRARKDMDYANQQKVHNMREAQDEFRRSYGNATNSNRRTDKAIDQYAKTESYEDSLKVSEGIKRDKEKWDKSLQDEINYRNAKDRSEEDKDYAYKKYKFQKNMYDSTLSGKIDKTASKISKDADKAVKSIKDWGSGAIDKGKEFAKSAGSAISKTASDVGKGASKLAKNAGKAASGAMSSIKKNGGKAISNGKKLISNIFSKKKRKSGID